VMPKIQWTGLPPALRDHLFERLRKRRITAEDLYRYSSEESGTYSGPVGEDREQHQLPRLAPVGFERRGLLMKAAMIERNHANLPRNLEVFGGWLLVWPTETWGRTGDPHGWRCWARTHLRVCVISSILCKVHRPSATRQRLILEGGWQCREQDGNEPRWHRP